MSMFTTDTKVYRAGFYEMTRGITTSPTPLGTSILLQEKLDLSTELIR